MFTKKNTWKSENLISKLCSIYFTEKKKEFVI